MDKERFQKQIDFILEIDKEKNIFRQTHLSGCSRFENDAEHAWHMAIMVYLLKEYSNAEFDVSKAMMMALIHDIVEIDAGDTYAYSAEDKKTQKEREEKAANRIFGLLPFEQEKELRALFDEFEAGETAEARFVRAMVNLQPLLLNNSNDGYDWKRHKVTKSQITQRQQKTKPGSETIWNFSNELIEDNVARKNIIDK